MEIDSIFPTHAKKSKREIRTDFDDFLPPQRIKESPRATPTLLKPQARKPTPKGHRRVHSMEIERPHAEISNSDSPRVPKSKHQDMLMTHEPLNHLTIPAVVISRTESPSTPTITISKTPSDEAMEAHTIKESSSK